MVWRLFLGYLVAELTVLVVLTSTIGLDRTLLLLLATFVVGVLLAGSQVKRQLARLRSGTANARGALTDGAAVALATVLIVVPGLVTSALGLLLLFPPTRVVARPLLIGLVTRSTGLPLIASAATSAGRYASSRYHGRRPPVRGDYIDGEVVDVADVPRGTGVESPALPSRPE
jgi:UPF0716 protein FxsA